MTYASKTLRSAFAALAVLAGVAGTAQVLFAQPAFARSDSRDHGGKIDRNSLDRHNDRQNDRGDKGDKGDKGDR